MKIKKNRYIKKIWGPHSKGGIHHHPFPSLSHYSIAYQSYKICIYTIILLFTFKMSKAQKILLRSIYYRYLLKKQLKINFSGNKIKKLIKCKSKHFIKNTSFVFYISMIVCILMKMFPRIYALVKNGFEYSYYTIIIKYNCCKI